MKRLSVIAIGTLFNISLAHATTNPISVDWTNYLAPMTQGCQQPQLGENFPKNLPKAYQQAITKVTQSGKKRNDDQDNEYSKTYYLKNSTAFGQPLISIQHLTGTEWGHWRLTFKDTNFLALRNQFKVPNMPGGSYIEKNDINGYSSVNGDLEFDKKTKTITCSYGQFS